MLPTIRLKKGREKPVHNRHPWIFSGAIAEVETGTTPGTLVQVVSANGRFLAQGYYNPHSQIQVRLLSWQEELLSDTFWQQQIQQALTSRAQLAFTPQTNAYRLIHAESDGLPGLVVDRYDDYLVMQCLTLGIDQRKEMLAEMLAELVQPKGIVERSDVSVRRKEGLKPHKGVLWGEPPPAELAIQENGHTFLVNLLEGHKTGFYLDQRDNKTAVCQPAFVANKRILNLFAYTGAFAVYAASGGAAAIINVDASIPALELAEKNMAANGFSRPKDEYLAGDAFEILRYFRDEGELFDLIVVDPPKFAHRQRDINKATRGYKDLNLLAMQLLRPNGLLATFSCSGLITADLFQKVLFGASIDAQRNLQIIAPLSQGADHPILLSFPESAYLKGIFGRVY